MEQADMTQPARKNNLILMSHVLLLILVCLIVFPLHADRMFTWLDGTFMRYLALQQHQNMSFFTYGMNILEGLGDMSFPLIANLIPATWLDLFLKPGLPFSIAFYTVCTVQYFFASYLLCRVFQFSKNISLLSSWLITLFVMPLLPTYHGSQLFYAISTISPYLINFLFFCSLFIYCFHYIGRTRVVPSILLSCVAFAIVFYLLLVNTVGILIIIPFFCFFCSTFILTSRSKFEFYSKSIFSILTILILASLHYFQFALGLFLYSIATFFPSNLTTNYSLTDISQLFNTTYPAGNYITGLGLLGLMTTLFFGRKETQKYVRMIFIYVLILLLFGLSVIVFPDWYHGPSPLYFEYILWPLYMAFAIIFILYCATFLYRKIKSLINHRNDLNIYKISADKNSMHFGTIYYITPLVIVTICINLYFASNEPKSLFSYPQTHPPLIIQHLIKNAAIPNNGLFKGYTAEFYPKVENNHFTDWYSQIAFDSLTLIPKLGYTYRMVGLWFFNIPSINKYSPISSPAFFALIHKTLSRPLDHEIRNVYTLTKINIPLLQALGVRFIITNDKITLPNTRFVLSEHIDEEHGSLYLYEILHTNVVSFSPQKFVMLNNVDDFLNKVNQQQIDFSKVAYVTSPISNHIGVLKNAQLNQIRDGVHLIANASGVSSVLLPILYSKCLQFKFNGLKPEAFNAQRANVAETLLVFNKHIDVDITYRYGLMKYADCRLEDRNDLKKIIHAKA